MRLTYLRLLIALIALCAISAVAIAATKKPLALALAGQPDATKACWTAPTQNTDGTPLTDLASYRVYHGKSSGVYETMPAQVPSGTLCYSFPSLTDGTHYFAVTAVNTGGVESDKSLEVHVAVTSVIGGTRTALGPYSYEPTGTTAAPTMSAIGLIDAGSPCGPALKTIGATTFCQISHLQTDLIGWPVDKTLKSGLWAKAAP